MPIPSEIKLHKKSKTLELTFGDGGHFVLTCEYLRVFSPSAEVRGHAREVRKLVANKKNVGIINIEPVGSYAVKLIFDDGHATGLYTWEILHELCIDHPKNWSNYIARLETAGLLRE